MRKWGEVTQRIDDERTRYPWNIKYSNWVNENLVSIIIPFTNEIIPLDNYEKFKQHMLNFFKMIEEEKE